MNAEQASKKGNAGADPSEFRGRLTSSVRPGQTGERLSRRSRRGSGDGMLAQENNATREVPTVEARDLQPAAREGMSRAARDDGEARSTDETG